VYGTYDNFLQEFQDILDSQTKAWENIEKKSAKLNLVGEDGKATGAVKNMSA
jgi:hypothetical protein